VTDAIVSLPRGGLIVRTSAGPVQFGLPPETIKDSMALGFPVPMLYVLPEELFDRRRGLNVAECEFPAYYNFFVLKRRIRLLVDSADVERRIRAVFQESLLGPTAQPGEGEFAREFPEDRRPDLLREGTFFRRGEGDRSIDVDTLIDFLTFDENGVAVIGEGVRIERLPDGFFAVRDGDQEIARAPRKIRLPERPRPASEPPSPEFTPPAFGVTVLGSSHGFDPAGKTTGLLLWLNRRGILVDPPVDASPQLRAQGVAPKLIDGIILTHCHADHDSGTFQKILEEGKITLYTTPTILGSFLRKYAALSGLTEELLLRTFNFHPVQIGAPVFVHGAEIWFSYALHSIPSVRFEVYFGGKSLVFSADTLYDPERIEKMRDAGVLSPGRAADLLGFPFHHTVVLHEAGVPPLHTPVAALAALPDEVKERLYLVHIAQKDLPADLGLKVAGVGLKKTLRINVAPPVRGEAVDVLNAFAAVDLFRSFPLSRAAEILSVAEWIHLPAGELCVEKGAPGERFFIIVSGEVSVIKDGHEFKGYQAGDFFGETAILLRQPRDADVVAKTPVTLLALDRYHFLYLLRGTDLPARLRHLSEMRAERSWEVIEENAALRTMTGAQKTQLQTMFSSRAIEVGEVLWSAGELARIAFLIDEGEVALEGRGALDPFGAGAFLGEFDAIRRRGLLSTTARVIKPGRVFAVEGPELSRFLDDNPGLLLSSLGRAFAE
jgi:CRP-like cAMP-binding protein/phosphoribosyl 1,2-cyclic phosphodiesterase